MTVGFFVRRELYHNNSDKEFIELENMLEEVENLGEKSLVFDLSDYPDGDPFTILQDGTLSIGGTEISPEELDAVVTLPQMVFQPFFFRTWDDLHDRPYAALNQLREYRGAVTGTLAILEQRGVRISCPPRQFAVQNWKHWQAYAFDERDIPTPETVVTSDPDKVASFVEQQDEAVIKPVTGGAVPEVVTPNELSEEKLSTVSKTPVQLQSLEEGDDVRGYVVDGNLVGAIHYSFEGDEFSFKKTDGDAVNVKQFSLPEEMQDAAVKATDAAGFNFGVVDFRYDEHEDDYSVLEVNPGGRFAAAEKMAGLDISGAIANWATKTAD